MCLFLECPSLTSTPPAPLHTVFSKQPLKLLLLRIMNQAFKGQFTSCLQMFTDLFRLGLCLNSNVGLGWSHLTQVSLYQCFLTIKIRSKRCASIQGVLVEC